MNTTIYLRDGTIIKSHMSENPKATFERLQPHEEFIVSSGGSVEIVMLVGDISRIEYVETFIVSGKNNG